METINERAKKYAKDYKWKFEDGTPEGFFIVSCINTKTAWDKDFKKNQTQIQVFSRNDMFTGW